MSIFNKNPGGYYQQPPNRRLRILIGLVIFLILTIVIGTLFLKPANPSDKFMAKVRTGDSVGSYALTSQNFKKTTSASEWNTIVTRVSKVYAGETKKIGITPNPVPADPPLLELRTYEVAGTGGPYRIEIYLVKESGKLRVNHFNATAASSSP